MTHDQLDRRLDEAAKEPERFEERARAIADELDARGEDLEIRDPSTWRKDPGSMRVANGVRSVEDQFREEVDRILQLDREEEAQLARRIEFCRLRLDLAAPTLVAIEVEARERADELGRALAA